jgi:AraC-like DNA-binding protein
MSSLITIQPRSHAGVPGIALKSPTLCVGNPLNHLRQEVIPQRIYGDLHELGVSIDYYDFELSSGLSWPQNFRRDCLELCLNLSGIGSIRCGENAVELTPSTATLYTRGENDLRASRTGAGRHRFITVSFSSGFLRRHLSKCDCTLDAVVGQFKLPGVPGAALGEVQCFTAEQNLLVSQLIQSHPVEGARGLLYQGLVLQLMAHFFFSSCSGNKSCCPRPKQLARERVNRVMTILRRDLAEPPALEEIGREVGCSPFHLSRTFSREVGMTIPQCLRKLRMECAANLLSSGKCNVTEAAMEVGYSSLSHFSRAFFQTMGCCPAMYSSDKLAQLEPAYGELRRPRDFFVQSIARNLNAPSLACMPDCKDSNSTTKNGKRPLAVVPALE